MPTSIRDTFNTKVERVKPQCKLKDHTSKCGCLKPFVRTSRLKEWMQKQETGDIPNGELLFEDVQPIMEALHANATTVLASSTLVFSWLVEADYGQLIHIFHGAGLNDARLGDARYRLDKDEELKQEFEQHAKGTSIKFDDMIEKLEDTRWEFCPHLLDSSLRDENKNKDFGNKLYIPFCQQWVVTEVGTGGVKGISGATAVVYIVCIQEEFVSEDVRRDLGPSLTDERFGVCYRLAIKKMENARSNLFSQERRVLRGIHDKSGMLRSLGFYKSSDEIGKVYHNILLEFADSNLHQYFMAYDPPQLAKEIYSEWKAFCDVVAAIETFHDFEYRRARWSGWHGDIKPRNLLRVGSEWKLADYGFTVFREVSTDGSPRAPLKECTQTWGAPETIHPGAYVLQTVDTWSFGCVLSLAATWMVKGLRGVLEYQRYRSEARKKLIQTSDASDVFHNNVDVLPQIKSWHAHLRQLIRKSDDITEQILKVVDEDLLVKDTGRSTSRQLREKLVFVLSQAKEHLNEPPIDAELSGALEYVRAHSDDLMSSYNSQEHDGNDGTVSRPLPAIAQVQSTEQPERSIRSGSNGQVMATEPMSSGPNGVPSRLGPNLSAQDMGQENSPHLPDVLEADAAPEPRSDEHRRETSEMENLSQSGTTIRMLDTPRSSTTRAPSMLPYSTNDAGLEELSRVWSHTEEANDKALEELLRYTGGQAAERVNDQGRTPIMVAAQSNKLAVVNVLIRHSNILTKDKEDKTVLHYLVIGQHLHSDGRGRKEDRAFLDTLKRLLARNPHREDSRLWIDAMYKGHHTCLLLCAQNDMPEAVNLLKKHGASVDGVGPDDDEDDAPIMEAMRLGNYRVVLALLEKPKPATKHSKLLKKYKNNVSPGNWDAIETKVADLQSQEAPREQPPRTSQKSRRPQLRWGGLLRKG